MTKKPKTRAVKACCWSQDDEFSDAWSTGCGEMFVLNEGTPKENEMRFCCFCGEKIEQITWKARDTGV